MVHLQKHGAIGKTWRIHAKSHHSTKRQQVVEWRKMKEVGLITGKNGVTTRKHGATTKLQKASQEWFDISKTAKRGKGVHS